MSRVLVFGGMARTLVMFRTPLLRALVAAGHEVIAAAPDEDPDVPPAMESLGVDWYPINFRRNRVEPVRDLFLISRIRRMIRDVRPDLVLCYTIKPNIYGGWAARAEGVPSAAMITGLGTVFMNPGSRRRIAAKMLRRACLHHGRVFVQNPDDRDDLLRAGVLDNDSKVVMTAGSGVDLESFPRSPVPDRPVFLMLARLLEAKGVREYLQAAKIVHAACPEVEIRLAGMEDPESGGVPLAEVRSAVDAGHLEYLGNLPDVRDALAACSVFVLPSWYEGTPHSSLEALATGRAIITTDARGCRETVQSERTGLLVPLRDPEKLAAAMIRLVRDPALRASMGNAGRDLAEERFDADQVAKTIMDALAL
ncbi:MAG: glycosyltransferase family 4 protein [Phycisphaerales bacterium]|nr:glycosyltransferase family 4 protein [Phycisphaerales bacterium]